MRLGVFCVNSWEVTKQQGYNLEQLGGKKYSENSLEYGPEPARTKY